MILQNSVEGAPNMDLIKEVAKDLGAKLSGGCYVIEDGQIYICRSTIVTSREAFDKSIPLIIKELLEMRELLAQVYVEPSLLHYMVQIVQQTRRFFHCGFCRLRIV